MNIFSATKPISKYLKVIVSCIAELNNKSKTERYVENSKY
jgi:hypothetical protein